MAPFLLIAAVVIAFASSTLLVPLVRRVALSRGWVDKPDLERKKHARPTPNVGGVAIVAAAGLGIASIIGLGQFYSIDFDLPQLPLFVGAIAVVLMGFYDDVHGLSFKRKFFFQIVIAYFLLMGGYTFDISTLPFIEFDPYYEALLSAPITIAWIVGIINAVNLLDGLDGLASGVAIIAFVFFAAIFGIHGGGIGLIAVALIIAAATGGFLIYNFNPASIFMGDTGSLFLGYMLAVYSLEGTAHVDPLLALIVPIVVLGLPILDTTLCMARRILDGISPFSPDSDHVHHRLVRLFPTRTAVLILYAVSLWFGIAALLITRFDNTTGLLLVAVTVLAAWIGIRTLGYLDIRKLLIRKTIAGKQLALRFAEDIPGPSWKKRKKIRLERDQTIAASAAERDGITGDGHFSELMPSAHSGNGSNVQAEDVQLSSRSTKEHSTGRPSIQKSKKLGRRKDSVESDSSSGDSDNGTSPSQSTTESEHPDLYELSS